MATQRRSSTAEFKREAAALVLDQGHSHADPGSLTGDNILAILPSCLQSLSAVYSMARPVKPLIHVNQVVETALAIIEKSGLEGLNMRTLGKELGVNPASLYHHFKDKDEILDAVVARLVSSVKAPRPTADSSWEEDAIALAKSCRTVIMSHPNAAMLVAARRLRRRPAGIHSNYEALIVKLCDTGFTPERALLALIALETLANGSAMEEATMGADILFDPVDPRKHPTLYELSKGKKLHVRSLFGEMCHLILMGLKAEQEGIVQPYSVVAKPRRASAKKTTAKSDEAPSKKVLSETKSPVSKTRGAIPKTDTAKPKPQSRTKSKLPKSRDL